MDEYGRTTSISRSTNIIIALRDALRYFHVGRWPFKSKIQIFTTTITLMLKRYFVFYIAHRRRTLLGTTFSIKPTQYVFLKKFLSTKIHSKLISYGLFVTWLVFFRSEPRHIKNFLLPTICVYMYKIYCNLTRPFYL